MKSVQLISPSRQKEWGLFAVLNFILGGAGTGLFIFNYSTILLENHFSKQYFTVPYDFLSLTLVALGFLCVSVEAGRPYRGYLIFKGLGKSWVSREVLAFVVFALAVLLSHFSSQWIFSNTCDMLHVIYSHRSFQN